MRRPLPTRWSRTSGPWWTPSASRIQPYMRRSTARLTGGGSPIRLTLGVFVTGLVHDDGLSVLWVVHDKDGDWLFGNGEDFNPKTASVIHLSHIVADHPDVKEVADLPRGWHARRNAVRAHWLRAEYLQQE